MACSRECAPRVAAAHRDLGFVARGKEPASVTTANWAIVVGLLSLFGWIILGAIGFAIFAPFALGAWATGWVWA